MAGRKFDPKSPRAIRGIAWQTKLLEDISSSHEAVDVRHYFRDIQGVYNDVDLCMLEHRFGDVMVFSKNARKHFECVVCPPNGNGYFPQHKLNKYYQEIGCDKWYAFLISEDGKNGEQIYIHSRVWNSYASKLPENTWMGKKFRIYSASILRKIRAKKCTPEDVILS